MNKLSTQDIEKLILSKGGFKVGKSVVFKIPSEGRLAFVKRTEKKVMLYDIGIGGPNYVREEFSEDGKDGRWDYDDFAKEYLSETNNLSK